MKSFIGKYISRFTRTNERSENKFDGDEPDKSKLLHALQVYKYELEKQNVELIKLRAQAERAIEKYTSLYDYAPTGYLSLSKEGRIIEMNLMSAQLMGQRKSMLLGTNFRDYLTPTSQTEFDIFIRKITDECVKACAEIEIHIDDENMICTHIEGVFSEKDNFCRISIFDISEHKKLEHELIRARDKAEEDDRLKSIFLANMSHEIRTPMNAIIGFSEILSDPAYSEEKKRHFAQIIQDRAVDLLRILQDILDMSKIAAGELLFQMSVFDLNDFLSKIYDEYDVKLKIRKSEVTLLLDIPFEEDKLIMHTDNQRLRQIFTNLLDNAIKFTREGSIQFGYRKESDQSVVFFVKDTGVGIPGDKQEIIFKPFRQLDETIDGVKQVGTGLGLAIVRGILSHMHGNIWLQSKPESGSTFFFSIPLSN